MSRQEHFDVIFIIKEFEILKNQSKSPLTAKHKQVRLQLARDHVASRYFWLTVVFPDEKSSTWIAQTAFRNIGMTFSKNDMFHQESKSLILVSL